MSSSSSSKNTSNFDNVAAYHPGDFTPFSQLILYFSTILFLRIPNPHHHQQNWKGKKVSSSSEKNQNHNIKSTLRVNHSNNN